MGVRRAATIGFVVVLLAFATIGQGGAAGATAVIIADLQCTGDVLVKRSGGEEVAAYVGLQLFPRDSITATAPAVVTLFDDGSGTTTQDVSPGTPLVIGDAKSEKRTLVAGLKSSLSDLFGSAEQARKRDQEVGAVQAGAVIARMPVAEEVRGSDHGVKNVAGKRELAGAKGNPDAPAKPAAPRLGTNSAPGGLQTLEATESEPAPAAPQAGAQPAPAAPQAVAHPAPAAPQAVAQPVAPPPRTDQRPAASPMQVAPADVAGEGSAAAPEVGGTTSDGPTDKLKAPSVVSDDFGLDEPPPSREAKETRARSENGFRDDVRTQKKTAKDSAALIARLDQLRITYPLARARVVAMPEGVPLLAGQPVRGHTTLTSGGDDVSELDQTLAPGARVKLHAELGGKAWDTELTIATDAEFSDVRARASELLRSELPNKRLLVANLLEARGYALLAYAVRIKTARRMEQEARTRGLMRSLWTTLGQQALQLGDWSTATEMAARARKK